MPLLPNPDRPCHLCHLSHANIENEDRDLVLQAIKDVNQSELFEVGEVGSGWYWSGMPQKKTPCPKYFTLNWTKDTTGPMWARFKEIKKERDKKSE